MIPRAVTGTPRYFALVVVCILPVVNGSHLKLPASGGAQQYVTFRCIHRPFHIVLVCPFGTDSQRQN